MEIRRNCGLGLYKYNLEKNDRRNGWGKHLNVYKMFLNFKGRLDPGGS